MIHIIKFDVWLWNKRLLDLWLCKQAPITSQSHTNRRKCSFLRLLNLIISWNKCSFLSRLVTKIKSIQGLRAHFSSFFEEHSKFSFVLKHFKVSKIMKTLVKHHYRRNDWTKSQQVINNCIERPCLMKIFLFVTFVKGW